MTALVTGGAKGIGKACVIELSRQGYNVVINYNTSKMEAETLASSLPNAVAIKANVADSAEVERMIAQVCERFVSVEVLVNNAGIAQQKMFCDITERDWDTMFDVNIKGIFNMCRGVVPQMVFHKYGKIVNISSIWGVSGASCEVHYSASKAAVIGFSKALARELGLSNINVNCIAPGVINTEMNGLLSADVLDELRSDIALNRLGTVEDIANLVGFLVSEKAGFITGQVITADGGFIG